MSVTKRKIECQVRDLTIAVEWPHPRRFRSPSEERDDPQLPFEVSIHYAHPQGGNMAHMQYFTQRALDSLFDASHIHACDEANRKMVKPWLQLSPDQQRRGAVAAFLYLYFLPDGEGWPLVAAQCEQMKTYISDDLFSDICEAFDVSHHERLELGR